MGGPPISRNITGVQRLVSNVSEAESRVTSGELEDYRWKPVGAGRLFGIKDSDLMSYLVESNVQILHIPAPVMGRNRARESGEHEAGQDHASEKAALKASALSCGENKFSSPTRNGGVDDPAGERALPTWAQNLRGFFFMMSPIRRS